MNLLKKNNLFNCDGFWREQNILKYLDKLDKQSKKGKDFKNKIKTLITKFYPDKGKMEYVIKYTTMQSYYLGLSKEEIKSFLKEDMTRYWNYLKELKICNDGDYFPFMKEEIKEFCETSQNCLFNINNEDVDKIVDDTFEYEKK